MPRVARGRDPLSAESPLAGTARDRAGAGAGARATAGLTTVLDLLLELPLRREDRARFACVADLVPGGPPLTLSGTVVEARLVRTRRRGFSIFEATLEDESGQVGLVFYNQPWLARWMTAGLRVFVHGRAVDEAAPRRSNRRTSSRSPEDEADAALSVGRVVPIYRSLPGLPPRVRRRLVARALEEAAPRLPERLPADAGPAAGAPAPRRVAPGGALPRERGRRRRTRRRGRSGPPRTCGRLAFEELLEFQVALARRRRERAMRPAPRIEADAALRRTLAAILPFPLTAAQKQAIREIGADLRSGHPMARLLQGDVGSGKTIVAVLTAVLAAGRGFQSALMAPTTILAEQHAETVFRLLVRHGRDAGPPDRARHGPAEGRAPGRARGGRDRPPRRDARPPREAGRVSPARARRRRRAAPVRGRAAGRAPGARRRRRAAPARPRPLGDADPALARARPPRRPRRLDARREAAGEDPDRHARRRRGGRDEAYRALARELESGGRAYVVVPLVDESESIDARAVASWTDEVARRLPGRRVGAVHGKMRAEAREKAMRQFAAGELDVLVATTVVEVGIDVPEASFLLVENAERFGLAQLHQLRGRIGRGARPSTCVLLAGRGRLRRGARRASPSSPGPKTGSRSPRRT